MMRLMAEVAKRAAEKAAKKAITPGPRDERGVLSARIVAAARDEFAQHGWAGTTIRAIARAADVDPALVYHYFGSKEGLLDAATNPPQKWLDSIARVWTTPIERLGVALIELLLASWADDEIGPTLRAILQTAAHEPTTREKLGRVVAGSLMGVSQLGVDERDRMVRSGLVSTQMMGFALMRYVWKIEPVASMPEAEVVAAISPNLQRYVNGDLTATG